MMRVWWAIANADGELAAFESEVLLKAGQVLGWDLHRIQEVFEQLAMEDALGGLLQSSSPTTTYRGDASEGRAVQSSIAPVTRMAPSKHLRSDEDSQYAQACKRP